MSKFIDAEKLIAEIHKHIGKYDSMLHEWSIPEVKGKREEAFSILTIVESLQQEQPRLPDNLDEAAKEYDEAESWSYEALPYPRRAAFIEGAKWMARQTKQKQVDKPQKNCNDCPHCVDRKDQYGWQFKGCFGGPYKGKFIAEIDECPLKQEQPEVDLDKEIEEHVYNMPHCEFSHYTEDLEDEDWARAEFRHFYELGKNARKEK